jgi:hypothetical protein
MAVKTKQLPMHTDSGGKPTGLFEAIAGSCLKTGR